MKVSPKIVVQKLHLRKSWERDKRTNRLSVLPGGETPSKSGRFAAIVVFTPAAHWARCISLFPDFPGIATELTSSLTYARVLGEWVKELSAKRYLSLLSVVPQICIQHCRPTSAEMKDSGSWLQNF